MIKARRVNGCKVRTLKLASKFSWTRSKVFANRAMRRLRRRRTTMIPKRAITPQVNAESN